MSDRELNIEVNAEGVEDAAGEFEDVSGATAGDGAPGGGGGGGGGRFGKVLTRLLALLAFLGPILDVLGAVSNVLTAFVAPLAVLLMRLLTPVLRLLLRALPLWFAFNGKLDELLANAQGWFMSAARTAMREGVAALIPELPEFDAMGLAERFGRFLARTGRNIINGISPTLANAIRNLPADIGDAISNRLPSIGPFGGDDGGDGDGLLSGLRDRLDGDGGGGDSGGTNINIGGGLGAFVDEITRNNSFDFP